MLRWIGTVTERCVVVATALLFCQWPLFMDQYTARLGGHVDELQLQLQKISEIANKNGKMLNQYIEKFTTSIDLDFQSQGEFLQSLIERYQNLSQSLMLLQESSFLSRPLLFIRHFDADIVKTTYRQFEPGLSLTFEAMAYAVVGVVVGHLVCSAVARICGNGWKRVVGKF